MKFQCFNIRPGPRRSTGRAHAIALCNWDREINCNFLRRAPRSLEAPVKLRRAQYVSPPLRESLYFDTLETHRSVEKYPFSKMGGDPRVSMSNCTVTGLPLGAVTGRPPATRRTHSTL